MVGDEHDVAFTVAKMMDTDLLKTVQDKLAGAIQNGTTLQEFRTQLIPELQAAGWWGKKDVVDPLTGDLVEAQLGSASRLETIFRSNLQSAYAVGNWDAITRNAVSAPFLLYDAVDDDRTRPEHAARDGEVHPVTSDFWRTHFPPNGWNCRCGVIQLDKQEVQELGLTPISTPDIETKVWVNPRTNVQMEVPVDVDPGWDHNPGLARKEALWQLSDEKADRLLASQRAAHKRAMRKQAALQAQYEKDLANDQQLQDLNKQLTAAEDEIASAIANNTPYLAAELKKLKSTKPDMDPVAMLAKGKELALKSEQNSMLQTWKQASAKGKVPSAKAQAYFDTLDPEIQSALIAEAEAKNGILAAKLELQTIAAGEAAIQTKLKQKIYQQWSKNGKASEFDSPIDLLGAIEAEAAKQQLKAEKSSVLSGYKKKVLAGQIPTPKQQQVFNDLTDVDKNKVLADIDAKKPAQAPVSTPDPEPTPAPVSTPNTAFNANNMTKIGGQGGSNPGGLYQDGETGQKWYIKQPRSEEIARNEVLAAKLYEKAGIEVPQVELVDFEGKISIASRIIDDLQSDRAALSRGDVPGAAEGFMMDAWLANWDVVGMGFDNLLVKAGRAIRVDTGGALRYRAQGSLKGDAWGDEVLEIESLRDGTASQTSAVFGSLTEAQLIDSARRVVAFTDADIDDLVGRFGPKARKARNELAATLKARRDYIAARYPEAVETPPPATVAGASDRVSRLQYENVVNSRVNGYGIRTDKDQIEDQQVLVWQKETAAGMKTTNGYLKVRGSAAERLNEELVDAGTIAKPDYNDVHDAIKAAIISIRHRVNNGTTTLDGSGLTKAQSAVDRYEQVLGKLREEVAAGLRPKKQLDDFIAKTDPFISNIKESVAKKRPIWQESSSNAKPYKAFKIAEAADPPPDPNAPQRRPWKRRTSTRYARARIRRGFAAETDEDLSISTSVYEYERDGVRVRYWADNDETLFAMRGRIEIQVQGQDQAAASRVFDVLEELGIDSSEATDLDMERLYLQQIAFANKLDTNATFKRRIVKDDLAEARDWLSKQTGVDLAKSPHYRPLGERQAFEHGRLTRYRPELLSHPDWPEFENDYRLIHGVTGGKSMAELVQQLLDGGGQMAPTTDKIRRGIALGGMSPTQDLGTGGANYFFTRIKRRDAAYGSEQLVWNAKAAARIDAISYDSDKFGRTTGDTVRRNRKSTIDALREASRSGGNETIIKDSLSIFDDLDRIVVADERRRRQIIDIFRKAGYDTWPDGRALTDVVKVSGRQ